MFCTQCGTQIPEGGIICPNCGKPVGGNKNAGNANNVTRGPVNDLNAGNGGYNGYNGYNYGDIQQSVNEAGKPFAIAALVLGIVALVFCFINGIVGLIAAIVGLVMASMSKSRGYQGGMRTAGFVLSLIAVIICAIAVIALIACAGTVSSILNSAARMY